MNNKKNLEFIINVSSFLAGVIALVCSVAMLMMGGVRGGYLFLTILIMILGIALAFFAVVGFMDVFSSQAWFKWTLLSIIGALALFTMVFGVIYSFGMAILGLILFALFVAYAYLLKSKEEEKETAEKEEDKEQLKEETAEQKHEEDK